MKKSILFVINTLGHAGAEMALMELLNHLNPDKYQISLYVMMNQGELVDRIPKHVKLLNPDYKNVSVLSKEGKKDLVKTVAISALSRGSIWKRVPYLTKNLISMKKKGKIWPEKLAFRLIADGAPRVQKVYDLAVAYLEGAATYYVADYVIAKKKACFVHVDYKQAGYTQGLDLESYGVMDRVFTVSDEVRDGFLEVYPTFEGKTYVFHNMINQDSIRRRALEPGGFQDDFEGHRLLSVGRLTYQKAFDLAIEAMKKIKEQGFSARWYVLGEGELRPKLEKQIKEAGLTKDFLLLGAINNPYPYFAQSDIYVHATRFEGKSIAIQEAQTLGCAIIASDSSGNREQIINNEDGILCELSPERIRDAVIFLIKHEPFRKLIAGNAKKKEISHPEEMKEFLDLLEE